MLTYKDFYYAETNLLYERISFYDTVRGNLVTIFADETKLDKAEI